MEEQMATKNKMPGWIKSLPASKRAAAMRLRKEATQAGDQIVKRAAK
jgi:hypothetical protein